MDPTSSGQGIRQFKTYLLHRLEKEEEDTKPILAKNDPREIHKFYQLFYEKNIREGQRTKKPEEMAKIYQIATVLYDVLRTVVPPYEARGRHFGRSIVPGTSRGRGRRKYAQIRVPERFFFFLYFLISDTLGYEKKYAPDTNLKIPNTFFSPKYLFCPNPSLSPLP